jgi:hypothetical protein
MGSTYERGIYPCDQLFRLRAPNGSAVNPFYPKTKKPLSNTLEEGLSKISR